MVQEEEKGYESKILRGDFPHPIVEGSSKGRD